jgi:hypothetical protein
MIRITANTNLFRKDMMNIIDYSLGFLDGINRGKSKFFNTIGALTSDSLKNFIDINAKLNPAMLQHVYEWYQVGSPEARLYNISYNAKDSGVSLSSTFSQSSTIKDGSNVPFYDKARIMENGVPVLISPKTSGVLVFEDNGETVFTKKDVLVTNPGGRAAVGGFEKTFDLFFTKYFSQAFMKSSGIKDYLENPIAYKANIKAGKNNGKSVGVRTGYQWIAQAGVA